MPPGFLDIATTPSVRAVRAANRAAGLYDKVLGFEGLGADEAAFIAERDSLYMATVSETGWPYVQHRGGPVGFLKTIDERTLGFADFRGNRQYLTLGNIAADNRAALILVDYPRRRLKLFARIESRAVAADPELAARLANPGYRGVAERSLLLHVEAFDWNCPQHIAPRFTQAEVSAASRPLTDRLAALEAENRVLRAALASGDSPP